jgi:hypothetical protein
VLAGAMKIIVLSASAAVVLVAAYSLGYNRGFKVGWFEGWDALVRYEKFLPTGGV